MATRTRRRRRRRRGTIRDGATVVGAAGALLALVALVRFVQQHLVTVVAVAGLAVAAATLWAYLRMVRTRQLAEHEQHVSVTDGMDGAAFEHYVARLMRASGHPGVRVSGGAGDMGADITARTVDGRRVVVQCKRYTGNLGSPDVQRFAGTARDIHRADVAVIVTTGRPTAQARDVARRCRITLVDRPALARWIHTGQSPLG